MGECIESGTNRDVCVAPVDKVAKISYSRANNLGDEHVNESKKKDT
jgi:hypothetical protein